MKKMKLFSYFLSCKYDKELNRLLKKKIAIGIQGYLGENDNSYLTILFKDQTVIAFKKDGSKGHWLSSGEYGSTKTNEWWHGIRGSILTSYKLRKCLRSIKK